MQCTPVLKYFNEGEKHVRCTCDPAHKQHRNAAGPVSCRSCDKSEIRRLVFPCGRPADITTNTYYTKSFLQCLQWSFIELVQGCKPCSMLNTIVENMWELDMCARHLLLLTHILCFLARPGLCAAPTTRWRATCASLVAYLCKVVDCTWKGTCWVFFSLNTAEIF